MNRLARIIESSWSMATDEECWEVVNAIASYKSIRGEHVNPFMLHTALTNLSCLIEGQRMANEEKEEK